MLEFGRTGKEVPTTPFRVLYNCVKDEYEFTIVDTNLDCEFYIYKGDLEDPILKHIVETEEVHCLPSGKLKIDLSGMLLKKVNELRVFAEENWLPFIHIDKDDEEFIYDFLEDLVNCIHRGVFPYTEKVVNILKG